MKKLLVSILVLSMITSLASCGKKSENSSKTDDKSSKVTEQTTDAAASEEKTTAETKSKTPEETIVSGEAPAGSVTDETKLGEAITYWVDGDYLYFKIKTSAEIDADRYNIDIVNPGIYLTRDSKFITQSIYENTHCFAKDFDKEYYDGEYVFRVDNNMITELASDESKCAPGSWSVLLYDEDTSLVLGQWLIVFDGGGDYHFEYSDSFLCGAGEDREAKEFDSLQDEVASWFSFNAYSEDWSEFFFDGFYLEENDPQGYDKYYMMICPEGDYTTYEDADAVDYTYSGIVEKCPYKFSLENYCVPDLGKYTLVLAKMGGNVEVQFDAEKTNATDWKMDFSDVKCPALEEKYK